MDVVEEKKEPTTLMEWVLQNKLRFAGGVWGTGMLGGLAYNFGKKGPLSLKIIHTRVFAQALTLGTLAGIGLVEAYGAVAAPVIAEQQRQPPAKQP
mmetsp:Transcript_1352/g.4676  ORF Transcript_1352/g.4676 Transcript_1352/m.4676 type:complete len:96 (+) Transcript_1352:92-379(+)